MVISLDNITYQDVICGKEIKGDDYNDFKESFHDRRRKALLENPLIVDKTRTICYVSRVDGKIIGHSFSFPTRFKAGNEIIDAAAGTSLGVLDEFRKYATGADLVIAPMWDKRNKALIYADFSAEGIAAFKAMRFVDFALPKMIQPHSSKFIFENFGLKGIQLKIVYSLVDILLKPLILFSMWRLKRFSKRYVVRLMEEIPEWIDEMVLNDGHKYMEVHDHMWMKWCTNNRFGIHEKLENYFYGIFDNNDKPIGFFLNKERKYDIPCRNISEMSFGTIMEWGSYDENRLSELDITKIAAAHFSDDIGAIQYCSNNKKVLESMKFYGFLHHGFHHIVFKDLTKSLKDAKDQSLWRLRFGYSDSIMN